MLKMLTRGLMVAVMAVAMTACGGGGGSDPGGKSTAGTTTTTTTTTTSTGTGTTTTPTATSLIYQLDKFTINNSGSDVAQLTVVAVDANNNPVSGQAVSVALDSGLYTPVTSTTDANGQVTGKITIGGNRANRTINATIKAGTLQSTASVLVSGGQLNVTMVPAAPAPGQSVTAQVSLTDSTGANIQSGTVALSGTFGFTGSVTIVNGTGSVTLNAPATPGGYTITATGLGLTSSQVVNVVSGGATFPNAASQPTAFALQLDRILVQPNLTSGSSNYVNLRAVFQNANNTAIQYVRVRFEITSPSLGSDEKISTGSTTVYSDASGVARSQYIPGARSSPTDGVTIRACYGIDDASIANGACPNQVTAKLTVAAQPLSITIGSNNLQEKGNFNLTYIRKFDVAVADAAGNAVANAVVTGSVDVYAYGKGQFSDGASPVGVTPSFLYSYQTSPDSLDRTLLPSAAAGRVWCPTEDTNRNGFLDAGEDYNSNGTLEPRKADVIMSFVSGNTTSSTGRLAIQVEYPMSVATWLAYTVRLTTNVAGSEGTVAQNFITVFIQGDETNGSFLVAPYGSRGCANAN